MLGGAPALAEALAAALTARGVPAEVIDEPDGHTAAISLHCVVAGASPEQGIAAQTAQFRAARAFAAGPGVDGGAFVVAWAGGGDFGGDNAWVSGGAGLVRTAALEWPRCAVRGIDLRASGDDDDAADLLCDELLAGGDAPLVGLRREGRVVPQNAPAAPLRAAHPVADGAFVLVSGGARGVTARCVLALAERRRLRVLLFGRSALAEVPGWAVAAADERALNAALLADARARGERLAPATMRQQVQRVLRSQEIHATISALQTLGSEVVYAAVDVTDAEAVGAAVERQRKLWGPVAALVHGAGVLADKHIAALNDASFAKVMDTKLRGLSAMLRAVKDDAPGHVALFSSAAARAGNVGQVAYAMANETLNRVAAGLAGEGCRAVALGWGPWAGGMVDAALARHFAAAGVQLIPLDEGAQAFVQELEGDGPSDIVLGDAMLGDRPAATARSAVHFGPQHAPLLADHAVDGIAVVPAAWCAELLARAAQTLEPDAAVQAVERLAVLRGIALPALQAETTAFSLRATAGEGSRAAALMSDEDERPRYRAEVVLGHRDDAPKASAPAAPQGQWRPCEYSGAMFHGPHFQVIREVLWQDGQPMACRAQGAVAMGWPGAHEQVLDTGALEAAMQMGVLAAASALNASALPTAIDRITVGRAAAQGEVTVTVVQRAQTAQRLRLDLVCSDARGQLLEVQGLSMHARPATTAARPVKAG